MLRPDDIALSLRLTTGRVYQLLRAGCIPSVRVGGRILIPRAAWDTWVAEKAADALTAIGGGATHV